MGCAGEDPTDPLRGVSLTGGGSAGRCQPNVVADALRECAEEEAVEENDEDAAVERSWAAAGAGAADIASSTAPLPSAASLLRPVDSACVPLSSTATSELYGSGDALLSAVGGSGARRGFAISSGAGGAT